jgi:hypothetical protein
MPPVQHIAYTAVLSPVDHHGERFYTRAEMAIAKVATRGSKHALLEAPCVIRLHASGFVRTRRLTLFQMLESLLSSLSNENLTTTPRLPRFSVLCCHSLLYSSPLQVPIYPSQETHFDLSARRPRIPSLRAFVKRPLTKISSTILPIPVNPKRCTTFAFFVFDKKSSGNRTKTFQLCHLPKQKRKNVKKVDIEIDVEMASRLYKAKKGLCRFPDVLHTQLLRNFILVESNGIGQRCCTNSGSTP